MWLLLVIFFLKWTLLFQSLVQLSSSVTGTSKCLNRPPCTAGLFKGFIIIPKVIETCPSQALLWNTPVSSTCIIPPEHQICLLCQGKPESLYFSVLMPGKQAGDTAFPFSFSNGEFYSLMQ